ncbi:MAG: ExbD/TolR family protein [Fibrobacterota bacterium]
MFEEYGFLRKNSSAAQVDMGPLLDMVFILLIFFVITTNFNRQTGVDVDKPTASSSVSLGNKTIMVGISREGTLHIHGTQVTMDELSRILAAEIEKNGDAAVVIVGDRGSTLGRSVEVMDLCSKLGAQRVSVAAEQE